jgi:hypothetical protein
MPVTKYVLDFAFLLENKVSKPMLKRNEIICKSYVILASNTAMYPAAESWKADMTELFGLVYRIKRWVSHPLLSRICWSNFNKNVNTSYK